MVNGVENIKEIFVRHADCVSDRPDHHYMTIMAKIDKGRKAVILLEEISLHFLPVISMFWHNTDKGNLNFSNTYGSLQLMLISFVSFVRQVFS